jgi:vitamin B12 transporter
MALKFETRNSPALMSGNVFWRKHTDHFLLFRSNPSAYENYHMTDIIGVALGKKISSRTGISKLELRYRHEQIFSTSLGDELTEPVEIAGTNNSYYNRFKSRDHINLTADHYFQINKLYLNVGFLLQTLDAKFSEAGFYPGIDLSYKMNENFTFFGAANRTMRLPTFTDLYYVSPTNLGNPDLKPEKAQTFEIGTKYRNEILDGTFSLFYRNGKETIDWIWQDSVWQSMNITNLDAFGLETGVSLNPNWIRTSSKTIKHLNISYSYTELLKSSESYISNYALDNLRHKLVVDLGIQLPLNFYLDIKTSWQDRNGSYLYYSSPSSDPYEIQYDNHLLIDVNAGVKLHRLTLFIDVSNLLNTTYRDIGSVVMPGRWFMAGIKFR